MSDLPSKDIEVSHVPEQPDAPGRVADALETVVTGVPAPIRKNLTTAIARLCTAATDWPATWLQGKAKELKAESDARVLLRSGPVHLNSIPRFISGLRAGCGTVQSCPRRRACGALRRNARPPRWATRGAPAISSYAALARAGRLAK